MGWVAPRANLHSARLSWVAADIRPIRDSWRRSAASTNKERRKSLRTLQGQFRLPRLSDNHHRVRCSAQMDSRANTCAAPSSTNSLVALAGEQVHLLPRPARRQRVAVVRYAQPELNGKKITAVNWDFFVIAADYAGVRASPRRCCLIFACRERAVPQTPNAGRSLHWTIRTVAMATLWPAWPTSSCPADLVGSIRKASTVCSFHVIPDAVIALTPIFSSRRAAQSRHVCRSDGPRNQGRRDTCI
jgi:hypothetical protein